MRKRERKWNREWKRRIRKAFSAAAAAALCAGLLAGCGSSDSDKESQAGGLLGSTAGSSEAAVSDSSAASSEEESSATDELIGRYISQGYENTVFDLKLSLPDTFTLESRASSPDSSKDVIEESNSEAVYDEIRDALTDILNRNPTVFSAVGDLTQITVSLQDAKEASLSTADHWEDDRTLAENTEKDLEETLQKNVGENIEVTEVQTNVREMQLAGEEHTILTFTCKMADTPYYGAEIYMISPDRRYLLVTDVEGYDINEVDQADQYFSKAEGTDVSDNADGDAESSESGSQADAAENAAFAVGSVNGSTYQNTYFGLKCDLDTSQWKYSTTEELKSSQNQNFSDVSASEKVAADLQEDNGNASVYTDMAATINTDTDFEFVTTLIEYAKAPQSADLSISTIIQEGSLKSQLEEQGYQNVSLVKDTGTFLGENVTVLRITANSPNGVNIYCIKRSPCICILGARSEATNTDA